MDKPLYREFMEFIARDEIMMPLSICLIVAICGLSAVAFAAVVQPSLERIEAIRAGLHQNEKGMWVK